MCTVSTTSLLMRHSRNRFVFKHHASGGLIKQAELHGSSGSQFCSVMATVVSDAAALP